VRILAAVLAVAVVGCASAPRPRPFTIAEEQWVERRDLPPSPRDEELADIPADDPGEGYVEPYEPGATDNPTVPGLVVSESRAARDALFRIRYDELRALYGADRLVWQAHRDAYELRLRMAAERIEELQPDWWDEHGWQVTGILGLVLGAAATIGIAAALDGALSGGI
jgi:hypothetical protein